MKAKGHGELTVCTKYFTYIPLHTLYDNSRKQIHLTSLSQMKKQALSSALSNNIQPGGVKLELERMAAWLQRFHLDVVEPHRGLGFWECICTLSPRTFCV